MRVVPGWVDLARFRVVNDRLAARRRLGWPIDRPVLLCLRRFVPRMGLDRFLRALALLRSTGRSLLAVLAGDGPLRGALRAQARSLNLSDSTEFPGAVEDDQLRAMYGAADAFVLPTAELECFGLIAIEAMACGTPVLATPVGAIPEILNGIEPRWLASDASAEALAGVLSDFLGGRLPVHSPGALRAYVRDHYSDAVRLPELVGALLEPEVSA
jgi:glycosyltransferase involved in cell wall biosynthesis